MSSLFAAQHNGQAQVGAEVEGVAALATLEIIFRGRPFSFSSDLRLSILLRSEKRAHLGQAPARTPR